MTRPAPAEFAEFVREVSIRALDRMAGRVKELPREQRAIVRAWSRLSTDDKHGLLNALMAAALATAPPPADTQEATRSNRPIHRYDPEEVEATLPTRPARSVKKSAAKTVARH